MLKSEFENLVGHSVSLEDYEIIENVYMYYYPEFDDKKAIAKLYLTFGMVLMLDMLPRAIKIREKEKEIQLAQQRMNLLMEELLELKTMPRSLERMEMDGREIE